MAFLKKLDDWVAEKLQKLDQIIWLRFSRQALMEKEKLVDWKTCYWDGGSQGNIALTRTGNPIKDRLIWLRFKLCRLTLLFLISFG